MVIGDKKHCASFVFKNIKNNAVSNIFARHLQLKPGNLPSSSYSGEAGGLNKSEAQHNNAP